MGDKFNELNGKNKEDISELEENNYYFFVSKPYFGRYLQEKQPTELIFIGQLLTGRADISQLSGPVGIAKMTGEAAKLGFLTFVTFFAYISISLGLMNLLPIPLLDGGIIVLFTIEKIIGGKIKKEYLEIYARIGLTLIMFLTIFAFYVDLFI